MMGLLSLLEEVGRVASLDFVNEIHVCEAETVAGLCSRGSGVGRKGRRLFNAHAEPHWPLLLPLFNKVNRCLYDLQVLAIAH